MRNRTVISRRLSRSASTLLLAGVVTSGLTVGFSTVSGASSQSGTKTKIAVANVPGVGTVLVNSQGKTLYLLSDEGKAKKITCTKANGCLSYWPAVTVSGSTHRATAGHGVKASLLGTTKINGVTYVTYAGWPLYTYAGDTSAHEAKGQNVKSFGGVWHPIKVTGVAVTKATSSSSKSSSSSGSSGSSGSTSSSSSSGGYGY